MPLITFTVTSFVQKIPVRITDRRPGDAGEVYAATQKAERELGWKYVLVYLVWSQLILRPGSELHCVVLVSGHRKGSMTCAEINGTGRARILGDTGRQLVTWMPPPRHHEYVWNGCTEIFTNGGPESTWTFGTQA